MNPFIKRVLIAVPAIALVLGFTFWNQILPFKAVAAGVFLLGLIEFYRMAQSRGLHPLQKQGSFVLLLILLPFFLRPGAFLQPRESLTLGLLVLFLTFLGPRRSLKEMVICVSVTFSGAVYFGLLGGYFITLREMGNGAWHLFWLYIATWAYDTGGYVVGKKWGRHRMTPLASPQKTWEGCVGGFLFCLSGLLILWKVFPIYSTLYSLEDVAALSVLLSLFGQLGDLVESMIKRSLSAKDSGAFFPGHGGIFDRIDSLLFNAPVLFYYLVLVKN